MPGTDRTRVRAKTVAFWWPDPDPNVRSVQLRQGLPLPATRTALIRARPPERGWSVRIPLTALAGVDRLEYQYEVDRAGTVEFALDYTNPERVGGAFGDKSSLELPGYTRPCWLGESGPEGVFEPFAVGDTPVGVLEAVMWSPTPDRGAELPVLLVHDGPEMERFARVVDYARAMIASLAVPPFRVALLVPGERNVRYAANPGYAQALVQHLLPALTARWATAPRPVLAGASLGGLAALHVAWTHPGALAGVFCQSGSFFTPRTDPQESGFTFFDRLTGFVAEVLSATSAPTGTKVAMTCGAREENITCNRLMAAQLSRLGLATPLVEHADLHTWTCWRDTFHPSVTHLLGSLWSESRPDGGRHAP